MPHQRPWRAKFADAFRGIGAGIRGQSSFTAHLSAAALAIGLGIALRIDRMEWTLIAFCIGLVLTAELINSALEQLARAVTREENDHIRRALDMAAGAVWLAALTTVCVGALVFGPRLLAALRGS